MKLLSPTGACHGLAAWTLLIVPTVAVGRPMASNQRLTALPLLGLMLVIAGIAAGCQARSGPELLLLQRRQEQLELKLQQLEQRLNAPTPRGAADSAGKAPAGPVKSITFRSGSADDRLRIYWADGSSSDLPCTKEQGTLVCG